MAKVVVLTKELDRQNRNIECADMQMRFYDLRGRDVWRAIVTENTDYPYFEVLKDISLGVPPGDFLGVLGRNGAGKSTLLRTIGGIYEPTSGIVTLGHQASGIYELGVSGQLLLTGREYAHRWLALNDVDTHEVEEMVEDIWTFSELGNYFDMPIRTYSQGMKARLYFGVATAPRAKVFLIDEVLSVGDIYFNAKCWRRLKSKLSDGASGILATHDWSAVLKLCKECCVLEEGMIQDYGPVKEVVQRYIVKPPLNREIAHLDLTEDFIVSASFGMDIDFLLPIVSSTDTPLYLGLSVEEFIAGSGWENVLHLDPIQIAGKHGKSNARIKISKPSLRIGKYALNFFLHVIDKNSNHVVLCDQRGWVYGNEVNLIVEGEEDDTGFNMPISWSVQ